MGLWDNVKGFAKSYIKTIFKGLAFKIIILSVAVVLILALLWYAIGHGTVSTVSDVIRSGDLNTNITIDENNRNYKIDETLVERVNQALRNMAINKSSVELTDDLLLKFYEAEIITSFPDLREERQRENKVPNGEIQGCIQFLRKYDTGSIDIEYIDISTNDKFINALSTGIISLSNETYANKIIELWNGEEENEELDDYIETAIIDSNFCSEWMNQLLYFLSSPKNIVDHADIDGETGLSPIPVSKYNSGKEEKVWLEFLSFKEFQQKLAYFGCNDLKDENGYCPTVPKEEIYTTKEQVESNYNDLRRYFTLDKENNLVVATLNSTQTDTLYNEWAKKEGETNNSNYTYNVSVTIRNYQTLVQKYSMPIEYLLSMLMVSENGKFCEAIADLAKESKIIIEVHDETTLIENKDKYDYKSNFYLERDIDYEYSDWGPTGTFMNGQEVYGDIEKTDDKTVAGLYTKYRHMDIDKDNDSYSTIITTSKNSQIQLCVTNVKTWILDATVIYEKINDINVNPITIVGDEPENKNDAFSIVDSSDYEDKEGYIEKVKDDETIDDPHNLMVKLNNYENMRNW